MKKPLGIILSLMLILTTAIGCSAAKTSTNAEAAVSSTGSTASLKSITVNYDEDDYYFDWKNSSYQTITLNGSSANATGEGVSVKNSTVTISQSGVYEISGNLSDGSIVVDVDKDKDADTVFLVLNGASIQSQTSAPIYVKDAKKAVILLEKDTTNSVADGSATVVNNDGEPSAAIFSKADLTISGSGALTVTGNNNDGITSKDDLKITDGTLTVKAKADGIVGKDILSVKKGNLTIDAGKDGMRSTNDTDADKGNVVIQNGQFTVTAANDAIQAAKQVQIDDGQLNLTSGGGYPGKSISSGKEGFGGPPDQNFAASQNTDTAQTTEDQESQKGLKGGEGILINGGTINVSSYEDSLHSNNEIDINSGSLNLQSGDDGIHADNNLFISNGEIAIQNSYESLEGANITISGGKITAASSDDGINVNNKEGVLTISGGEIALNSNGDGLDSNGSIKMTGGTVNVDGPAENMNGAIDYDQSFTISGGTLIASGSSGMAQAPSDNTQPSILMYYSSTQTAGSTITLKDKDGAVVASFTPTKDYSSAAISSPKLSLNSSYTLYSNDTKIVEFTLADSLTYLSESGVTSKPQNSGPGGGGMGPDGVEGTRPDGAGGMPSPEGGTAPDNSSSQE
ncbi:hypothetical protein Desor_4503 [Desulfosporosinus orientis DSM 765]|uniref:Carbohydrate-binding domain-containing protein n=1 Tax=Desulfosporosinus orientis (strain ATCC 19365 / DSM 765 / NCIMB 8382 / VKM B-1628 / Singapore I) TaxID=768706 RepID=G7W9J5_DESOD|nr:carbohydrate-binding domain-containing protein [Desulfosporosinus orientis]AET69912.1 hypothetical protein Desor_4503 [Desulfosporosinus orientis DSM 765]